MSVTFGSAVDSRRPLWRKIEAAAEARDPRHRRQAALEAAWRGAGRRGRAYEARQELLAHRKGDGWRPPGEQIICETVEKYGVPRGILKSSRRGRELTAVRFELCWRLYSETNLSLSKIGRMLDRDHTTILSAVRQYMKRKGLPLPEARQ
jgi:hypothetical protein